MIDSLSDTPPYSSPPPPRLLHHMPLDTCRSCGVVRFRSARPPEGEGEPVSSFACDDSPFLASCAAPVRPWLDRAPPKETQQAIEEEQGRTTIDLPLFFSVLLVPGVLARLSYEEMVAVVSTARDLWERRDILWAQWIQCWGEETRRLVDPSACSPIAGSVARRARHRQVRTVREALDDGGRGVAEPRSLLEHRGTFLLEPFLWECEEPLLIEADAVRLVRSGPWAPERRVRLAAAPTAVDEEHAVDLAHFIGGLLTPHMLAPEPPVSEDTPHGATVTHVSSVDAEGQGGDNVLLFEESDAFVKFWSSAGGTATSTDSLTISVTPNFIAGLVIRFFRAQFQVGMPLF